MVTGFGATLFMVWYVNGPSVFIAAWHGIFYKDIQFKVAAYLLPYVAILGLWAALLWTVMVMVQ